MGRGGVDFFAVDRLASCFPELTPFQFASNTPIISYEIQGLEGSWGCVNWTGGYDINPSANQEAVAKDFLDDFSKAVKTEVKENAKILMGIIAVVGFLDGAGLIEWGGAEVVGSSVVRSTTTKADDALKNIKGKSIEVKPSNSSQGVKPKLEKTAANETSKKATSTQKQNMSNVAENSSQLAGKQIIVDENLSPKLINELTKSGFKVKTFSKGTTDDAIIAYAQKKQCCCYNK